MRTRPAQAFVAVALLLLGTACSRRNGASKPTDPVASIHTNRKLRAELPAAIRTRGEVRVVTDASYAPASSFAPDGRTIIGFEPDLGAALGKVLGVRVVFRNAAFDTLPQLVRGGSADMIISAMTDTAERERLLDFVDYFTAGTSIVVQRGNPHEVSDLQTLCGQRVAVEAGTVQEDLLHRQQTRCGARPLEIRTADTNDDALLLLRTGRAAALLMDYPPAELLTTDPSTRAHYQLATTAQYEPGLYGFGFAKDQVALRDAVAKALGILLDDGAYRAVLRKWDVPEGAVTEVSVNAASSG